jgi:hypothetical protein
MILRLEYLLDAKVILARELTRLHPYLQLLFLRLFLMTDGAGRFKADAAEIRAGLYAHELHKVSERDVVSRLQELHRADLIKLYTEGAVGYGKVADRFWLQRDSKRKVRHPDEPPEQPELLALADPALPKPRRSGGAGNKDSPPFYSTPFSPAHATAAASIAEPETDAAWLARLTAAWPAIDIPAQLAKAHKKRRGDVERGWFESVWLPGVTPSAPHPSSVLRPPSSVPSEPAGWRATLEELFPGNAISSDPARTWASVDATTRERVLAHQKATGRAA